MNDIAMSVRQNLNFDVPRVNEAFFKVNLTVAERHLGFRASNFDEPDQFVRVASHADSAPSASSDRLHHYREVVPLGKSLRNRFALFARREDLGSGDTWNSGFRHDPAGDYLAAQIYNDLRRRSDENQACLRALLRKSRIFGKKTVTGVYCFSLAALRRLDDALDIQVIFPGAASDTNRFIGAHYVHRSLVGVFVDGDSLYPQFLGRTHYAYGDLASVGNQQLFEHLQARFRKVYSFESFEDWQSTGLYHREQKDFNERNGAEKGWTPGNGPHNAHAGPLCGWSQKPAWSIGHAGPFGRAARSAPLVCVLPAHEVALEGLDYDIDVPLGPVVIPEQILDA
jgi:hypothetical protein